MKIVSKLKIAVLVPVLIVVVAGLVIGLQGYAFKTARGNIAKVGAVISSINNFNNLIYSYMLYQEERPHQQFMTEYQNTTRLLAKIQFRKTVQQQQLKMLQSDLDAMKNLFAKMVSKYERLKLDTGDMAALEAGRRLGGQLLAASSQTLKNGLALARIENDRISSRERMLNFFFFILIIGVTITLTYILAGTMKAISVSLVKLANGVEIIASGNRRHRIGMTEPDELGDLARSFDKMTTELEKSEEQLRDSKETLQLAIEATNLGTFDYRPRTGELIWADLAKLHFGLPPEADVKYDIFLSGLHPEDRDRVHRIVQEALRPGSGGIYRTEYRTVGIADEKERWLSAQGRVVFNEKDQPERLIGTTLDITERKRTEQALQQALAEADEGRHTLEAMMEHIPMGITIADAPDVRIRVVSRYGRELTGKPRRQLENITVERHVERWQLFRTDGVTPADNEELPLTRATRKGEIVMEEEWVLEIGGDGRRIPILCTAGPIRDKSGNITGGVIGWQDISTRKRNEQERERLIAELESSNRELQQFAYVSSHDLQEPLRTVTSFVELLALRYRGRLDEDADRYIASVVEGANRMSRLINDLLGYSRIVTREKPFAPVAMKDVVGKVVSLLKAAIEERQVEIDWDELPVVVGDESQFVQLLQNLIGNAIKFTQPGVSPRIRITTTREDDKWVFGVHDNGIGVDPRFFERIFVIFQRLHTREQYPGTGIGLALCRKIVERHGGRIWVESRPDEGSSFYFSLPGGKAEIERRSDGNKKKP